jgi:transcription-repair coupling factor (superfamily II helicase)
MLTHVQLPDSAHAFYLADRLQSGAETLLYVARDAAAMERLSDLMARLCPDLPLVCFPAWDVAPYDRNSPKTPVISERMRALSHLLQPTPPRLVITTVNALTQHVPPREAVREGALTLRTGQSIAPDALYAFLQSHGYQRVGKVMEAGEFAVRGGIIDLFPSGSETGVRMELFGNDIESLHRFDPLSQVGGEKLAEFTLLAASELPATLEAIQRFRQAYRELGGSPKKDDALYHAVSEGRRPQGIEHWLPLFYAQMESLLDYLPQAHLVWDHTAPALVAERHRLIEDYYAARKGFSTSKHADTAPPLPPHALYLVGEAWETRIARHGQTVCGVFGGRQPSPSGRGQGEGHSDAGERIPHPGPLPEGEGEGHSHYRPLPPLPHTESRAWQERLSHYQDWARATRRRLVLACLSEGSRERLLDMLLGRGVHCLKLEGMAQARTVSGKSIGLLVLPLEQGWASDELCLVSEIELIGGRLQRAKPPKKGSAAFLAEAASLLPGECVVHRDHGIGRFEGLETLTVSGAPHDCLKLIYDGGDKLFIPVENSDILSRFGGEESTPRLDKLGGVQWQARKAKLKERITEIAGELLKIAAERSLAQAPELTSTEALYQEFCARFPYAETDDQLQAIEEVRADLQKGTPMDRLVCGDVGFGKTEVALRAAFLAVTTEGQGSGFRIQGPETSQTESRILNPESRIQVAIIAPTTLLCRQHYKLFTQRFEGFGFRIRQLSRMVSAKEAADTKERLARGEVDIVVGTHALLSKDVRFANLGLMIVDEEQHFGVVQKEKIKSLRTHVHVLTLTATPIPRTLQLALTGVKELSLITTPPVDRIAVRSFVMPFDPVVLREAIQRERTRGGQLFYVCPRIEDLAEVSEVIQDLVPEASFRTAHGQMPATELDRIMNDFYDAKFDILVSTTIVESGLDVPNANTIIIHRSDMFGLAQLYQLRGRVGRGKTRSYAYFVLPAKKQLTAMATKRLEVMQTLDTLGAGFTLASHDMDIRGYGNLLGDEQSGHIREVGVELYQQMLEEAIQDAKSRQANGEGVLENAGEERFSPQINLGIPVRIPETYVEDLPLRMGLYKRLSLMDTEEEVAQFGAELIDRFGAYPADVGNLLAVVKLKQRCREAHVERMDAGPNGFVVTFRDNKFHNPMAILELAQKEPGKVKIRPDQKLVWMQSVEGDAGRLQGANAVLNRLIGMLG